MTQYLLEIKNRLFILLVTYLSTIVITYYYKEVLLFLIVQPNYVNNKKSTLFYFIFTDVTEIFSIYIKLLIFVSFQILIVFILYHIFVFLSPAFLQTEYKYFKMLIKIIILVWCISMFLANYIIIPLTWSFFISFQDLITNKVFNMHFEAKLSEYLYFYISLYYLCSLYFQVFVLLFFILSYVNTNVNNIKKFRKLYYFGFVVFSTLISPPDIVSQMLISIFLIVIYEILLFVFLFKIFKNNRNYLIR